MKNIQKQLTTLLFIALIFPHMAVSQEDQTFELAYEVNRVFEPLSISRETLDEALTVSDLNEHYKSSWVKEYKLVEVITSNKGQSRQSVSKDEIFNQEQLDNMKTADVGTSIRVNVHYIPDNTLSHNDVKEFDFAFKVNPENTAKYAGGKQQLKEYIRENAIDKISNETFEIYKLTAVKFTIDEEGHVIDPHVVETSKDEQVDNLLVESICNMPRWEPAEYADGMRVKQDFVLTIGDHTSCIINLLNVRRDRSTTAH